MNHNIDMSNINVRTDLAIEEIDASEKNKFIKESIYNNIKVSSVEVNDKNKDKFMKKIGTYITIEFTDATDYNNSKNVEEIFIKELKKILKTYKINDDNTCLVIGLGNDKSTPDSLGPLAINDIIVTNHYFELGINVEDGFRSVAAISPGTMGQTGIETFDIINAIVKEIKPDFVIVIDALKASSVDRVNKTIQITDAGINPGSGIGNNRKEISKEVLNIPVIAVGIPTVVDTITIVNDSINYMTSYFSYMKENIDNPKEKLKIIRTDIKKDNINIEDKQKLFGMIGSLSEDEIKKFISEVLVPIGYNMIVTPKDIDFIIKRLSCVISTGINNVLHKNVTNL
ncbi:MAG: GPR endopeptidase [Bacilli bacterium]|nr:GPR endopeptidase [Bacilli bacterium]